MLLTTAFSKDYKSGYIVKVELMQRELTKFGEKRLMNSAIENSFLCLFVTYIDGGLSLVYVSMYTKAVQEGPVLPTLSTWFYVLEIDLLVIKSLMKPFPWNTECSFTLDKIAVGKKVVSVVSILGFFPWILNYVISLVSPGSLVFWQVKIPMRTKHAKNRFR